MENDWDDVAASWDTDPGPTLYAAAAFESLSAVVVGAGLDLDGSSVLDFGAGTGLLTGHLVGAGSSVWAVDNSPAMLAILTEKIERLGWEGVWPTSHLPSQSQTFDLVVCSSVCSFLDDYPGTAADLVSRLRPGGLFVQWDWERVDPDGGAAGADDHGLTRAEIHEALAAAGLSDVTVDVAFSLTVDEMTMTPLIGHGRR